MRDADVLVVNGRGFEAGLLDTISSAEADGAKLVTAIDGVPDALPDDPHFFTDPVRMSKAATYIAERLTALVPRLESEAFTRRVTTYTDALAALDRQVRDLLADLPPQRRVLVTNHDAFGHFADRYGFTFLGAVIPSFTTGASASASDLAALAATVREHHVPAIFAETSSPKKLADSLAAEVGGAVEVVELYSESLGPKGSGAETYIGLIRTDAQRIAAGLR
jgi:zinc/manganese transport system substrate-binding protein